jgi:predicted Zn-dependent protease
LAEAEKEYRELLKNQPDECGLKVALANVYFQAEKNSQAMVISEDLLKRPETPASALVLHARLLVRAGEIERAVRQYRDAVGQDPDVADSSTMRTCGR